MRGIWGALCIGEDLFRMVTIVVVEFAALFQLLEQRRDHVVRQLFRVITDVFARRPSAALVPSNA